MPGFDADARPDMRRFAENIRTANEIAGRPIGESYFAAIRRDVEAANDSFA